MTLHTQAGGQRVLVEIFTREIEMATGQLHDFLRLPFRALLTVG